MNCKDCKYNMKDRVGDDPIVKGKVACKYRTIKVHGYTFNTMVYVDPTDKCPYARKPSTKPVADRPKKISLHTQLKGSGPVYH